MMASTENNDLPGSRRRRLLGGAGGTLGGILAIAVLVVSLYANSLDGSFHLDDLPNIVENPYVQIDRFSFEALYRAAFKSRHHARPLANITYSLNYLVGGLGTRGYHMVNLVVHVAAASVLYLLLLRLVALTPFAERDRSRTERTALLATLLWAAHPVQTQAVTYIVQRMTSMATLFYFAALLCFLSAGRHRSRAVRIGLFGGFCVSLLLGIGSKEIAATAPFAVLLCAWLFQEPQGSFRKKEGLVILTVGLAVSGVLFHMILHGATLKGYLVNGYESRPFSLEERVFTQFRIVLHYLSLLAFPHPSRLNIDHFVPLSTSVIDPPVTLLAVAVVTWLIVGGFLTFRRRPLIAFAVFWYFGNLFMESSVVPLELMFEHRLYLPSLGPILLVAAALVWLHGGDTAGRGRRWTALALMAGLLGLFSVWTVQRNVVWKTEFSLWSDAARKSPTKVRVINNLANVLAETGKHEAAISRYRRILKIHPESARVHNNLGSAYFRIGRPREAVVEFRRAVLLEPGYGEAWFNLGVCLVSLDRLEEGLDAYERAMQFVPHRPEVHYNLGNALKEAGRDEAAIRAYRRCVELNPAHARALNNLGSLYFKLGRRDEAVAAYRRAAREDPEYDKPHFNLAILLAGEGEREAALDEIGRFLEIRSPESLTEGERNMVERFTRMEGAVTAAPLEEDGADPITEGVP